MPNDQPQIFPAYCLVAQFADGARLTFGGFTEQQAMDKMEAAQAEHGDITWYDGVTDEHYESGLFHAAVPDPPHFPFPIVDLTDAPEQRTIFDPEE
ncbi:MAG: hypothetical protein NC311_12570 [Muribaculaceae bacterium]|nr:hypothetical protein [Muribaculaceae bacterium]MCM1439677.1 hypothetical protein [Roseburia sp.]